MNHQLYLAITQSKITIERFIHECIWEYVSLFGSARGSGGWKVTYVTDGMIMGTSSDDLRCLSSFNRVLSSWCGEEISQYETRAILVGDSWVTCAITSDVGYDYERPTPEEYTIEVSRKLTFGGRHQGQTHLDLLNSLPLCVIKTATIVAPVFIARDQRSSVMFHLHDYPASSPIIIARQSLLDYGLTKYISQDIVVLDTAVDAGAFTDNVVTMLQDHFEKSHPQNVDPRSKFALALAAVRDDELLAYHLVLREIIAKGQ